MTTPPPPPAITVLLADDSQEVRHALGQLLEGDGRFRLVGSVGDGDTAVELALEVTPDLAVVDVRMPGGGVEACRRIRLGSPGTTVVVEDSGARMRLLAGGLAAQVARQAPGRQISVSSPKLGVRVVGTVFSVVVGAEADLVEVSEGRVEVEAGGSTRMLNAGMTAVAIAGSPLTVLPPRDEESVKFLAERPD